MSDEVKTDTEVKNKPKNPKRVEAGKKGAEAKRLKKVEQQSKPIITEITKNVEEHDTDTNVPVKINVYKNYLPIGLMMIGIAGLGLYVYKNKPVKQVDRINDVKVDKQPV